MYFLLFSFLFSLFFQPLGLLLTRSLLLTVFFYLETQHLELWFDGDVDSKCFRRLLSQNLHHFHESLKKHSHLSCSVIQRHRSHYKTVGVPKWRQQWQTAGTRLLMAHSLSHSTRACETIKITRQRMLNKPRAIHSNPQTLVDCFQTNPTYWMNLVESLDCFEIAVAGEQIENTRVRSTETPHDASTTGEVIRCADGINPLSLYTYLTDKSPRMLLTLQIFLTSHRTPHKSYSLDLLISF